MNIALDVEKSWLNELGGFISEWEQKSKVIQDQTLDLEECDKISECFHKDTDRILLRSPVGLSNYQIYTKLEQLEGKLNSTLAMICTSKKYK